MDSPAAKPGGASRNSIEIDGEERPIPAKVTMSVQHGALITHEQAGAGGFGDPLERPAQLVLDDLKDGKISAGYAKNRHGVVLTGDGAVDEQASTELRQRRKETSRTA